jgi:hypothetical protein
MMILDSSHLAWALASEKFVLRRQIVAMMVPCGLLVLRKQDISPDVPSVPAFTLSDMLSLLRPLYNSPLLSAVSSLSLRCSC